jgi:hypothetical protein
MFVTCVREALIVGQEFVGAGFFKSHMHMPAASALGHAATSPIGR